MKIDKLLYYTLNVDGEKYQLPYAVVRYKIICLYKLKSLEKFVSYYKKKNIQYKTDKKNKIVYRMIFKENIPFDEKKRLLNAIIDSGFSDYVCSDDNWYKQKNRILMSCMANYLLKGEEDESDVLTSRQIRYINEVENDVDFLSFEDNLMN